MAKKEYSMKKCPVHIRTRGYLSTRKMCKKCTDSDYCFRNSITRTKKVADDLSFNLHEFSFDIARELTLIREPLKTSNKINFKKPYFKFKKLIREITKGEVYSISDIEDKLMSLKAPTHLYLCMSDTDYGDTFGHLFPFKSNHECDGPHFGNCPKCKFHKKCKKGYLTHVLRVPHYVMSQLPLIGPSDFKVLMFIATRASYSPSNEYFGQAMLRYDDIEHLTGVKTVGRCVKNLAEHGLIKIEQHRARSRYNTIITLNKFTVHWFHQLRKEGIPGYVVS